MLNEIQEHVKKVFSSDLGYIPLYGLLVNNTRYSTFFSLSFSNGQPLLGLGSWSMQECSLLGSLQPCLRSDYRGNTSPSTMHWVSPVCHSINCSPMKSWLASSYCLHYIYISVRIFYYGTITDPKLKVAVARNIHMMAVEDKNYYYSYYNIATVSVPVCLSVGIDKVFVRLIINLIICLKTNILQVTVVTM